MPYIKSEDYARAMDEAAVPGELNYAMTMGACIYMRGDISLGEFQSMVEELVDGYMDRNGTSYTNYNNVIGALFCCGSELLRRVNATYKPAARECYDILYETAHSLYNERTVPYEDTKIAENGDVFPREMINGA